MSTKRKANHRKRRPSQHRTAQRPPAPMFEQVPGVWYPLDLTAWSLAHLIRHAEDRERPRFAEWAGVAVGELEEWAEETIHQLGGEVSEDPNPLPDFGEGAWSFVPVTRSAPPDHDPLSVGPQALWTVYRQGVHNLAFSDEECDRVLDLADDAEDVWIEDAWIEERCAALLVSANEAWFRYRYNRLDKLRVQHYPKGLGLDEHFDRWVGSTTRDDGAGPYMATWPERVLVSVTKVQDCAAGGDLQVRVKKDGYRWHTIPFERGDTVVMSPWLPHRVTPVEAGHRVTLRCALDYWR